MQTKKPIFLLSFGETIRAMASRSLTEEDFGFHTYYCFRSGRDTVLDWNREKLVTDMAKERREDVNPNEFLWRMQAVEQIREMLGRAEGENRVWWRCDFKTPDLRVEGLVRLNGLLLNAGLKPIQQGRLSAVEWNDNRALESAIKAANISADRKSFNVRTCPAELPNK